MFSASFLSHSCVCVVDTKPTPQPHSKPQSAALYGSIAAGVIILVLVVILVYFVVRHRRLQQSFMSFANSHYDTRSGTATFANTDDDGGDLGT